MKKQCKSSIIKNHKITKKKNVFDGVPLKGYVGFFFLDFSPQIKKAL